MKLMRACLELDIIGGSRRAALDSSYFERGVDGLLVCAGLRKDLRELRTIVCAIERERSWGEDVVGRGHLGRKRARTRW